MKLLVYSFILSFLCVQPLYAQPPSNGELPCYTKFNQLKDAAYKAGNPEKHLSVLEDFQQLVKANEGEQDSLFIILTIETAMVHLKIGNADQALQLALKAVDLATSAYGQQHINYVEAISCVADAYTDLGAYSKAVDLFREALDVLDQIPYADSTVRSGTLANLGDLRYRMGYYEEALLFIQKALVIEEKVYGREHEEFASSLNLLARVYTDLGDYEKALSLYLETRNIKEKILGKEHPETTLILNNLAIVYYQLDDIQKALTIYLEIKAIDEKNGHQNSLDFASLLNNLAVIYQDLGHYKKSLNMLLDAHKIEERLLGTYHPELALSYNNLAFFYQHEQDFERTLYFHKKTHAIYTRILNENHPDLAISFCNLAYDYEALGKEQLLHEHLQKALATCANINIPLTIDAVWKDQLLETKYASAQHISSAIYILETVYEFLPLSNSTASTQQQQLLVSELIFHLCNELKNIRYDDKDKLRALKHGHQWLKTHLSLLQAPFDNAQAFAMSDWSKSALLLQALQSEEAYQIGNLPDKLVKKDKELHKRRTELQAQLLEDRPAEEKKQLNTQLIEIDNRINRFEQYVKENYPKYYQLKYQDNAISLQDIQSSLDTETALIEYVIGDSVLHIFCVEQQSVDWVTIPIRKKLLHRRIKSFRKALCNYQLLEKDEQGAYSNYTKHAHWFFQQLLTPVLNDKTHIHNLIIVTDGELGHLPFETFLLEEAPQHFTPFNTLPYLLYDFNVSYSYSAALWKENISLSKDQNNGQIFGVAANYDNHLDSSLLATRTASNKQLRKTLIALPNARQEIKNLANHFEGFFVFDQQASERMIKNKVADYAVLHFATHGVLNEQTPTLSSLALTEDGDSVESNFWQAYEISKIDLKADLVVLSACETGFGKFEQGNGIASLARSFMYAGAPSLVVSLWQVNDYTTSEIMKYFYHNLSTGMKKDAALRQAKISYLKSVKGYLGHPTFWSPFIQMGSTSPIQLTPKTWFSSWWMWLVALGVLAVAGGYWYRRKKYS